MGPPSGRAALLAGPCCVLCDCVRRHLRPICPSPGDKTVVMGREGRLPGCSAARKEHLEGEPLRPGECSLSSANFCPLVLMSIDDSCQNQLLLRSLSNDVFRIPSLLLYSSLGFLLKSLSFSHRVVSVSRCARMLISVGGL